MKIQKLTIRNFCGISDLELEPADVNEISGDNGTGKSSIIRAIITSLGGGASAKLIRNGEKKSELGVVLDDGHVIKRTLRASSPSLKITKPDGEPVAGEPQAYLDRLSATFALNPVRFLDPQVKPKERLNWLLSATAARVTAADLAECGVPIDDALSKQLHSTDALEIIDTARDRVYGARRETNRLADEARKTADNLRRALPDDPGVDLATRLKDLQAEMAQITAECATARTNSESRLRETLAEMARQERATQEQESATAAEAIAELEKQIAVIRARLAERKAAITAARDAQIDHARMCESQVLAEETAASNSRKLQLEAEIRATEALAKEQRRGEILQAQINAATAEAETRRLSGMELTNTIERLDTLKGRLLSSIPIPGLEVQDGDLYLDGVPWDLVNTARQVDVAFEIAGLQMGELEVMCIDGFERLSRKHREAVELRARRGGIQLFVTRVTDDAPLEICTR